MPDQKHLIVEFDQPEESFSVEVVQVPGKVTVPDKHWADRSSAAVILGEAMDCPQFEECVSWPPSSGGPDARTISRTKRKRNT